MAITPKYTDQIVALVTEPDGQALRAIAEAEQVSVAEVIRNAVTLYLAHRAAEATGPDRGAKRALEILNARR